MEYQSLQEYLEWKYPTREDKEGVRKIDGWQIVKEFENSRIRKRLEGGELDLREFKNVEKVIVSGSFFQNPLTKLNVSGCVNLTELFCSNNKLTSLDMSGCVNLTKFDCRRTNLITSLKVPDGFYWKMWTKIRDKTKPEILGLEKLIDTSDLDNWVKNYDGSKNGDIEYHKFVGEKAGSYLWFTFLDYTALDNLGNKVIARKTIVLARLLTPLEDLQAGKNKEYEEKMNELAEGWQMCGSMNLPGKTPDNPWTEAEQQEAVNQALSGDKSLLQKLQDLPYLKEEFRLKD